MDGYFWCFFLLGIGSIAVLTYILPYAAMHDMDDKWKEYRNKKSVALADAEFPGKTFGISAYVHGCRLLKRYLK